MTPWEEFRNEGLCKLLASGARIIDIGGGLRARRGSGNRYDPHMGALFGERLKQLTYQIVDPVPDFSPDIVGDIHNLPLPDESVDGVICIAVLEHVENPMQAMSELCRVTKPGGMVFVFVPFLYYYHAEVGYYHDYWRYTKDSLGLLAQGFSHASWAPVRGATETWFHLSPLGRVPWLKYLARAVDSVTGKSKSDQVSGYYGLLVK